MLVREGLNVIAGSSAGQATLCGSVTLAREGQMERNFFSLTSRRLSLAITTTIEQAIRWAVFEAESIPIAARIQSQIHAYMCSLADSGASDCVEVPGSDNCICAGNYRVRVIVCISRLSIRGKKVPGLFSNGLIK